MPQAWVEPELFITHNGVSVYHTYKDGNMDAGRLECHYTTDICEEYSYEFDIRDLPSYQPETEHAEIIKSAIEMGEIKKL